MSPTQIGANEDLALEKVLRQIESEPPEGVRARERNTFDEIAGPFSEHLVLFGAGTLGKDVLAGLRRAGIEPLSFADNNQRLSGKEVSGLLVLSPDEAVRVYGETACFVVTIYQGSRVRRQLASLGCRRVAPYVPLLWKYADIFIPQSGIELPHRLVEQCEAIRECHANLADDKSRRELREQLLWRYWLDYSALSQALEARDIYFPLELLAPLNDEVFVDCGSFQGDTLTSFVSHWEGRFQHIYALEPDSNSRAALAENAKTIGVADRVTVMPYAVGSQSGLVSFASMGTMASRVVRGAEQASSVECQRLDEISWPVLPTYIKMDIEGAEPEGVVGATGLLRQQHAVLAICTYHRSVHLWEIPNLIRSIAPDYNFFLRRYGEECWEGVCYAIPSHRLKRA